MGRQGYHRVKHLSQQSHALLKESRAKSARLIMLQFLPAPSYPTLVPHSSQNFAPGFSSCWQFAHFAGACEAPHSRQNFEPAGSSAPHLTHLVPTLAPPEADVPASEVRLIASDIAPAIALPTANPAPRPPPRPAPPLGFCAASRIASAA